MSIMKSVKGTNVLFAKLQIEPLLRLVSLDLARTIRRDARDS